MRINGWLAGVAALVLLAGSSHTAARQLGGRNAAEWSKVLDSPNRIAGLKIDDVIARLKLKPGDRVVDVGAGTGSFSLPLAKALSPGGLLYAVEIEQGLLDIIRDRAAEQKIENVRIVLGAPADPKLPAADIDVAFFHDVLHHIADRAGYLEATVRYLKPSGRIAVVEYDPAVAAAHKSQPEMRMTREQTAALLAKVGFKPVEEINDLFTDKWFVVYGR